MLNGRLEVLTLPRLDGKIAMVGVQKAGRTLEMEQIVLGEVRVKLTLELPMA